MRALMLAVAALLGWTDLAHANSSLIQLRSRTFDVHAKASRIPRDDHFIPLTDVRWLNNAKERDPHLHPTVIHIDSRQGGTGRYFWEPDSALERYLHSDDLPWSLDLDEYHVRWESERPPKHGGGVILIPKSSPDEYYVSCAYDKADEIPNYCLLLVSYPPDLDLRIKVRIYQVTNPLNDFRTMARKARAIVYCLDVTDAVASGNWEQGPYIDPDGALPDLFDCDELQS